jgi:channel protein (hemolysin III family)
MSSLFYLHNESVNVYTHLIGAIAFIGLGLRLNKSLRSSYSTISREDIWVLACFFIGCIFCLGTSATYHLISNHSYAVSRWGNQLDYLGIVFLIWGSFIPSIYYGFQQRIGLVKIYWIMVSFICFQACILIIDVDYVDWISYSICLNLAIISNARTESVSGTSICRDGAFCRNSSVTWIGYIWIQQSHTHDWSELACPARSFVYNRSRFICRSNSGEA